MLYQVYGCISATRPPHVNGKNCSPKNPDAQLKAIDLVEYFLSDQAALCRGDTQISFNAVGLPELVSKAEPSATVGRAGAPKAGPSPGTAPPLVGKLSRAGHSGWVFLPSGEAGGLLRTSEGEMHASFGFLSVRVCPRSDERECYTPR